MSATSYNIPTESITLREGPSTKRLLFAFAHPDDESFGPAGSIIHYSQQPNTSVHYICGTRGEAGSVDEEYLVDFDSIAQRRTHELLEAAKVLGFHSLHFLNYRDSGMENSASNDNPACLWQAPVEAVARKIVRLIRQIKPQVVVTFDPTGGYFHPDHIKMHQATTLAFYIAGSAQYEDGLPPYQPQKLYFTVFPRAMLRAMVRMSYLLGKNPREFGKNKDIDLVRIAEVEQTSTTKINVFPYYTERVEAAACHASQGSGRDFLPAFIQQYLFRYDTYMRVHPPLTPGTTVEDDFFAGLNFA